VAPATLEQHEEGEESNVIMNTKTQGTLGDAKEPRAVAHGKESSNSMHLWLMFIKTKRLMEHILILSLKMK
jgi:hypothetical protein